MSQPYPRTSLTPPSTRSLPTSSLPLHTIASNRTKGPAKPPTNPSQSTYRIQPQPEILASSLYVITLYNDTFLYSTTPHRFHASSRLPSFSPWYQSTTGVWILIGVFHCMASLCFRGCSVYGRGLAFGWNSMGIDITRERAGCEALYLVEVQ